MIEPIITLNANPGQTVYVIASITNPDGYRQDPIVPPNVDSVFMPDGYQAAGFPTNMQKLDTGLFRYPLTINTGIASLGTYIITVNWEKPITAQKQCITYIIQVALPFGNSSISPA